jgi:hypothetical protein
MAFCPICKSELESDSDNCKICGYEIIGDTEAKWVFVGLIEDKMSADFAKETLKSYNIPAVIFSKSGFFGDAGLPLNPFYSHSSGQYEVSVPIDFVEEANDILLITLGDKWHGKEC